MYVCLAYMHAYERSANDLYREVHGNHTGSFTLITIIQIGSVHKRQLQQAPVKCSWLAVKTHLYTLQYLHIPLYHTPHKVINTHTCRLSETETVSAFQLTINRQISVNYITSLFVIKRGQRLCLIKINKETDHIRSIQLTPITTLLLHSCRGTHTPSHSLHRAAALRRV